MKKILKYIFILLIIVLSSCVGVQLSSGVGVGITGGPCGVGIGPTFNPGVYGGGYR